MNPIQEFTADTVRVFIQDGVLRARVVDTVFDDKVAKAKPDHIIEENVSRMHCLEQITESVYFVAYSIGDNATVWWRALVRTGHSITTGSKATEFETSLTQDEWDFYYDAKNWCFDGMVMTFIGGKYQRLGNDGVGP